MLGKRIVSAQGFVPGGELITNGLTHHWPLLGSLVDTVKEGGDASGTLIGNGASITETGLVTTDQVGGCATVNEPWFSAQPQQFSLCIKVNMTAWTTNPFPLMVKQADSGCSKNQREFFLNIKDRIIRFKIYGTQTSDYYVTWDGQTVLQDGSDYSVCVTYDGQIDLAGTNDFVDRTHTYINGSEESLIHTFYGPGPMAIQAGTALFAMSCYANTTMNTCGPATSNQRLWDSRIYNRVLSPAEAIQITSGLG